MPRIIYNKLVRDRIPEIIQDAGKKYKVSVMDSNEYEKALLSKLLEEVEELIEAKQDERIKEIADVLEVLYSLIDYWKIDGNSVNNKKEQRAIDRGRFQKRIKLLYVEE